MWSPSINRKRSVDWFGERISMHAVQSIRPETRRQGKVSSLRPTKDGRDALQRNRQRW